MNVLFVYAEDVEGKGPDRSPSVGFRCRIPADGLNRAGHKASLMSTASSPVTSRTTIGGDPTRPVPLAITISALGSRPRPTDRS